MSHRKTNPQVQKTQRALREAFLELVLERGFESVYVSDVAQRAGVNRATFYRHYRSTKDLLRSWTEEVREVLENLAHTLRDPAASSNQPEIIVRVFEHIYEHRAYYQLMVGRQALNQIATNLEKTLESFILAQAQPLNLGASPLPGTLLSRAYAAEFVGVTRWWLEQKVLLSPAEISEFYLKLTTAR